MIPGKAYTPEVLLQIAWRRKWWIVLPAVLIAGGVSAWAHQLPNLYRSETLILVVPQRVPETYVRSTVTTRIEDRLQSISQQILSRTRLERIIQDFNLYETERRTGIMEDIVEHMRASIEVRVVQGDAFRVSFVSDNPQTVMKVTERLASLFIDESLRDREVLAEGTNQFMQAQLDDAKARLLENEKKLELYRRQHEGELPTQLASNMQGLHNTEMQLQELVDSLNRDRDRRLVIERTLADAEAPPDAAPAAAPAVGRPAGDEAIAAAGTTADQLHAAQEALRALQLRLTPQHPDVVRMTRIITELQAKLEEESLARPLTAPPAALTAAEIAKKNRLDALKAERDNLDRQVAFNETEEKRLRGGLSEYQKRIEMEPTRESELTELMRDYDTLQAIYKNLLAKNEDSKVSANLERRQIGEQFKILDPARLPEKPTSPDRPRLYLMGVAGGVGLGLALAVLLEYLDKGMRSEADVLAALNLAVLATVPLLRSAQAARRRWRLMAISIGLGLGATASVAFFVLRAWHLWK